MASEGFVFGQNLADRVILPVEEKDKNNKLSTDSDNATNNKLSDLHTTIPTETTATTTNTTAHDNKDKSTRLTNKDSDQDHGRAYLSDDKCLLGEKIKEDVGRADKEGKDDADNSYVKSGDQSETDNGATNNSSVNLKHSPTAEQKAPTTLAFTGGATKETDSDCTSATLKACSSKDTQLATKDAQSLSGSAVGTKRKFDAITGEEDELTVFEAVVRLFIWDIDTANWIEKGRGVLKLNDLKESPRASSVKSAKDGDDNDDDEEEEQIPKHTPTAESSATEKKKEKELNESESESDVEHSDHDNDQEKTSCQTSTTDERTDHKDDHSNSSSSEQVAEQQAKRPTSPASHAMDYSRLIMRVSGTLRIILNLRINPDYVKIMPTDDDKSNVFRFSDDRNLWAVKGTLPDIGRLRKVMRARLTSMKKAKS